jgi:hypothetical protein
MPTKVAFSEFPAPELSGGERTWGNKKIIITNRSFKKGKEVWVR